MVEKKLTKIDKEIKEIEEKADISEAYFVGLLWDNPLEEYSTYSSKTKSTDFLMKSWGFFFELGNILFKKGLKEFDDISVNITVKEIGMTNEFKEYGGIDKINELVEIVKGLGENAETYYESLVKNKVIVGLIDVVGNKVLLKRGKYDYKKMTASELSGFWLDKLSQIALDGISTYDSENLYIEANEFIDTLSERDGDMIKFSNSKYLNMITNGIPRGEVTMIGGFGNSGKSSFMTDKVLLSFLKSEDKTLVVLNEEPANKLREKLFLTLVNHEMNNFNDKTRRSFPRWKLNKIDTIDDDEKQLIYDTFDKWKELTEGDDAHIKIIYMEQYRIEDLKNIVTLYANRGYVNLIIDTHKVPDNYTASSRWEAIVEATKEIYKLSRSEGNGFNLRTVLTVQLADAHVRDKFLGFDAIGEGKAMKNEASIFLMYRPLFTDEIDKLEPYTFKKGLREKSGKATKVSVKLDPEKTYYVMFIPKNRFGSNTDNGQDCILYEARFDYNSFVEVGYVKIPRTYM